MSAPENDLRRAVRQHPRLQHYRDLSLVYEGYSEEISIRAPDLSVQGMFINTTRHFPEGAVLKVTFRLARSGYEVHTRAEVRYCLEGVGVGVEFFEISPEDRSAIDEELGSPEPNPAAEA